MSAPPSVPLLLYDGGCQTCTHIANWVKRRAAVKVGQPGILARPVGNDPAELRQLNANLDIWDAYATVHVLMPDGTMQCGGEAVAEVLRCLPVTHWMTPCLDLKLFGARPFQNLLNFTYRILDDIRPVLGCDSCGRTKPWVAPVERLIKWVSGCAAVHGKSAAPMRPLHFRPLPVPQRPSAVIANDSADAADQNGT